MWHKSDVTTSLAASAAESPSNSPGTTWKATCEQATMDSAVSECDRSDLSDRSPKLIFWSLLSLRSQTTFRSSPASSRSFLLS
jgi:hypothetical protein